MIKIAYIIDTIDSPTAGTEKQLLLLLKNLNRKKVKPYLCVLESSKWLKTEFNLCPVYVLGIKSFKYPNSYYRIWKFANFLRKQGIDIVQTHFRDSNIAGILAGRMAGVKVISTRRNQGYWLNRRELMMQKFLNRWVAVFIANSYSTKNWAAELEDIPEDRIQVVYNGIDLDPYLKLSPETRARYRRILEIPESSPAIGIVANLRPVKGIDIFLRAAQLVKEEVPEAKFVIVGDGTEKNNLMRLSEELGLNGSVKFLGKREDVIPILSTLDVGVLSSHSESFSNSVLEYLAVGLPVVCTDVGGCREAVEDGVNGFVVHGEDFITMAKRIVEIIKKGLVSTMGASSRHRAQELFILSRMIDAYMRIYSRLIGI